MVSIYNLENAGRKLKPYHLVCLQECGSTNDSGEKGNKLPEQILFNFLPLFSTLYLPEFGKLYAYFPLGMGPNFYPIPQKNLWDMPPLSILNLGLKR